MRQIQPDADTVKVEIELALLQQLFQQGVLCPAQVSCLDETSKRLLWDLCLSSCAKRKQCNVLPMVQHRYAESGAERQPEGEAEHLETRVIGW